MKTKAKRKPAKPALEASQETALAQFAAHYGRTWKAKLAKWWIDKQDPHGFAEQWRAPLTRLRNTHGPSWLAKYKPAKAAALKAKPAPKRKPKAPAKRKPAAKPAAMLHREQWLADLAELMRPWFEALDYSWPQYRVSCGWTSQGARSKRIGECWHHSCSGDSHHEIFISPLLDDAVEVAQVLAHEMCHAVVGVEHGHKAPFAKAARAIHLEGKLTATVAGDAFKQAVAPLLAKVGAYPHAKLEGGTAEKKQTTRLIKAQCPACEYTVRVTAKWVDIAEPVCPNPECEEHGNAMRCG